MKHTFEVRLPDAKEVYVCGTFNNWQKCPMKYSKTKKAWVATLDLKEGRYEYKILADGKWIADPTREKVTNPFGTENSLLIIS
jgi:1,4-alpha-glucan branching enzyme